MVHSSYTLFILSDLFFSYIFSKSVSKFPNKTLFSWAFYKPIIINISHSISMSTRHKSKTNTIYSNYSSTNLTIWTYCTNMMYFIAANRVTYSIDGLRKFSVFTVYKPV